MRKKILSLILLISLLLIWIKSYAWLQEAEQALQWVNWWTEEKLFIDSTLIGNKAKVDKLEKLKDLSSRRMKEYKNNTIIKNVYAYLYYKIIEVLSTPNRQTRSLAWWWSAINNPTWKCSFNNPCKEWEFCRIKTWQCFPLAHKDRGFRWFPKSWKVITAWCSWEAVQNAINSAWAWDTIKVPACKLSWRIYVRKDNVIIRWAWMWKTFLKWEFDVRSKNVIISDFTIDASWYRWAIDGYNNTWWNLLFERIEASWAWKAWDIKITRYPYCTVRYSKLSNSLHWIANKMANKSQIYSNEAFGNSNYWMDSSTVDKVEIAWNYFHDNVVAWAKTPNAKELHYHHNDMNNNKYWIIYYRDWWNSWWEFWKNTLDQKWEVTLEYNNLMWNKIHWFNWHRRPDVNPQMNYLILKYNTMDKFSCVHCKRVEVRWNNWVADLQDSQLIKH